MHVDWNACWGGFRSTPAEIQQSLPPARAVTTSLDWLSATKLDPVCVTLEPLSPKSEPEPETRNPKRFLVR